jgi:lysozyme
MLRYIMVALLATATAVAATDPVAVIKKFEGFRSQAYWDVDHFSIGYGTPALSRNEKITEAEADRRLRDHLRKEVDPHLAAVKVKLTPGQRAALTSFVFNLGGPAFRGSTLLKKLNKGDFHGAEKELLKWKYARKNGKPVVLPGLLARRQAEVALMKGGKA